ncbi:MAG TPA: hypothetical protein VF680_10680 [Allosphingosinicella sp.]|jgi:hypothetical protein
MTIVGLFGILISLAGFRFARASSSPSRFLLFALLLPVHIGASVAGYYLSLESGSDAQLYYYDPWKSYGSGTGVSTIFIINLVQFLKSYVGGSFLDYFLLFQAAGFWGILFIIRAFDDIHQELGRPIFSGVYLLLFLPGLHFWTSAIGKDGLMFLAVAMCAWAAFRLKSRYLVFGAGIAIALLVRPHIALVALVAFALALLVGRGTSLLTRAALLAVVLAGISSTVGILEEVVTGLNFSSTESMAEVFESRNRISEESGADATITGASFPVRLLSLLFRPFFFDAKGLLGYAASLENLLLLAVIVILLRHFGTALALARATLFARFAFFFFILVGALLATVNYNVGLGLRQKMMMMPALLTFFAATLAVRSARKRTVYDPGPPAYAATTGAVQGFRRA